MQTSLVCIVDGDDWSLPEPVQPTPGTGFGWVNPGWVRRWTDRYPLADAEGIFFAQYVEFTWAEVNPRPGIYDWELIDAQIEDTLAVPGLGFGLWPKIYGRSYRFWPNAWNGGSGGYSGAPMVPRWLEERGQVRYTPAGHVAAWEPPSGYLDELRIFLLALGQRYKDHPMFAWVDCRYIDPHAGEGRFLADATELARAEREFGLTPDRLERFMRRYIDIFAEAFAGQERKVSLANWEPTLPGFPSRYGPASERIWRHALDKGFGGRDGQVEVWYRYTTSGFGIAIDDNGYMHVDEGYPPIKEDRFWATENENYLRGGDGWHHKFGPNALAGYRWFASSLRLLQMRRNWDLIFADVPLPLAWHELTRYVQLSLGKTPRTSPDAWCWLREGYKTLREEGGGERALKNFERWLIQRDVAPDGMTQPAAQVDISLMGQGTHASRPYEFQARRTDRASGQTAMYFQAYGDWFGDEVQTVRAFVTFLDASPSTWSLEYDSPTGRQRTPEVRTTNSGTWRTAVFRLLSFHRSGAFPEGMDFRLVVTAGGDLTTRMVRLVKWPE